MHENIFQIMTCPECGEDLTFRRNADITFKIINRVLRPVIDSGSIGMLEECSLECTNCLIDDQNNKEIEKKLKMLGELDLINSEI